MAYSDFDQPPTFQVVAEPKYALMAVLSWLEGVVPIAISVDSNGVFCDAIVDSISHPLLIREAIKAARRSRYNPATRVGERVPGVLETTYIFDMKFASVSDPDRRLQSLLGLPPYVREVGAFVDSIAIRDNATTIWKHDGVLFCGDISVQSYRDLVPLLNGRLADSESVYRVTSYYMSAAEAGTGTHYVLVALVETCTYWSPEGNPGSGNCYGFSRDDKDEPFRIFGTANVDRSVH
ncbi:MAG TPA: energy transducer TonB [Candidatus Krumholzibacteria bacterium]|nr:energy transducer TonB [Candidatus Krumholzibacteria bacterium]HPD73330.1 energy transducer TonB [Candidatus Krumholzibacteria bacterium]HRY42149.1 energy transducer TonB [Candidatus Krumholzibacteria bacterium]